MKKVLEINDNGIKLVCYYIPVGVNRYGLYRKARGKANELIVSLNDLASVIAYIYGTYGSAMRRTA